VVPPVRNPFRSILVRGLEVLHALGTAARLARHAPVDGPPAVPVVPRAGAGWGATEAPRGLLWHGYELDDEGTITAARIVPPTSQNQLAIEGELRALGPRLREADDAAARRLAERVVRNHDPCISCSTHFLTLTREGA
jgi:coenzyme F420-reducing hydrogenase alpha subunit